MAKTDGSAASRARESGPVGAMVAGNNTVSESSTSQVGPCQRITVRVLSNYGARNVTGLTELEIFDGDLNRIKLHPSLMHVKIDGKQVAAKVQASPGSYSKAAALGTNGPH